MKYYIIELGKSQLKMKKFLEEVSFIMEILITGIFTIILLGIYASLGFVGFMFIQLISYRIFNFNIYKNLMKMLEVQAYEN
jgi:hypothetical protein